MLVASEPLQSSAGTNRAARVIEVISTVEDFLRLKADWDALWCTANAPAYYQTFDYALACWELVTRPADGKLYCVVGRQNGQVRLIWPMATHKMSILRIAGPLATPACEYTEPLLSGTDPHPLLSDAWATVRRVCRADILRIPLMIAGSPVHSVVAADKCIGVDSHFAYATDWLDLGCNWDTYYQGLSSTQRRREGKKRRRLAEQGALDFEMVHDAARATHLIDWCFRQKQQWAEKYDKKGPWLYSSSYRDLLVRMIHAEDAPVRFAVFSLTLNGQPIAVKMVSYGRGRLDGIISGYDPEWQKYSPGTRLDEYGMKWAFENGFNVDCGIGTEIYKQFWTKNNVIQTETRWIPGSARGTLALLLRQRYQNWRNARAARQPDRTSVPEADTSLEPA